MKPNLCNPGKIDQDCADLKERKQVVQDRVAISRANRVVVGEIQGKATREIAQTMNRSHTIVEKIAKTPESEVLRKQYRSRREKTVKAQVAKINTKHRALITGKGWDSNDAPKANVELRAIIHADKVMGLGQDVAPAQNVATDLVGAAQTELAGLMLLFVRPDKQKELQTVEAEVVDTGEQEQEVQSE